MDGREGANGGEVLDGDVAGERGGVDEEVAVANLAIVADVGISQKEVFVPEAGDSAAFLGAAADCDVFAEDVFVTRDKLGAFAAKRVILGIAADHTERVKDVSGAETRRALDDSVGMNEALFAQLDVIGDHGKRTDLYAGRELRGGRDGGARMNFGTAHLAGSFAF